MEVTLGCERIVCHENSWDSNVLGVPVYEIDEWNLDSGAVIDKLFSALPDRVMYITRIESSDHDIAHQLIRRGFSSHELSLDVYLSLGKSMSFPNFYRSGRCYIEDAGQDDLEQIALFSGESFHYSRYHENPEIDRDLCSLRVERSIPLLMSTGNRKCLVSRNEGKVISFMIYHLDDRGEVAFFDLGGSRAGYGSASPHFWGAIIEHFKNMGVKKIRTRISAANNGVANIYWSFGFRISKSYKDFHRMVVESN